MDIRNERGVSPAEGCMFGAMALFALLLVALLIIAAIRFSSPPESVNRLPARRSAAPAHHVPLTAHQGWTGEEPADA